MPVSDFQRQVATIALNVAAGQGFVLGGGNALILHGIVDRYTADVDLVTNRTEGGPVQNPGCDRLQGPGFRDQGGRTGCH
jgi:hypothetical protein